MELPADSNARDLLAAQEEREKLSHHKKSILTQAFMSSCKFDYDLVHKALKDASAEALLAQRQLTAIASVEAKGTTQKQRSPRWTMTARSATSNMVNKVHTKV